VEDECTKCGCKHERIVILKLLEMVKDTGVLRNEMRDFFSDHQALFPNKKEEVKIIT